MSFRVERSAIEKSIPYCNMVRSLDSVRYTHSTRDDMRGAVRSARKQPFFLNMSFRVERSAIEKSIPYYNMSFAYNSNKLSHSGLSVSINAIFFFRDHFFNCFSLAIAS